MKKRIMTVPVWVGMALLAAAAWGDAANRLFAFSTPGTDRYADGSRVLDGEWYALVWSADGVFEGLTGACRPEDPADAVVLAAPLAKGGCCPFSVFQVDSRDATAYTNGTYAVLLLDTRTTDGTSVAERGTDGLPVRLNAAIAVRAYAREETAAGSLAAGAAATSDWTRDAAAEEPPKVVSFAVREGVAEIGVEGLQPEVRYNVRMGATLDGLTAFAFETPKADAGAATFVVPADSARFFQVVREPLLREGRAGE